MYPSSGSCLIGRRSVHAGGIGPIPYSSIFVFLPHSQSLTDPTAVLGLNSCGNAPFKFAATVKTEFPKQPCYGSILFWAFATPLKNDLAEVVRGA